MYSLTTWFINNPVASKLAMVFIIVSGILSFPLLDKEFFPKHDTKTIKITVPYPSAGPDEVEKQICQRIEEAVKELGGIEEVRSVSREGLGSVTIEIKKGEDTARLLNEVKASVESIDSFPSSSEVPRIVEERSKSTIMGLQLSGNLSERDLKELGEEIREEIASIPSVAIAELRGTRDYEISIEISQDTLLKYNLTFEDIANSIRSYSLNVPAGKIRSAGGDIILQAKAQANSAQDFEIIPVKRNIDGTVLRLGDIANIIDGFDDSDIYSFLNKVPSLELWISSQSNPNILKISSDVKDYISKKNNSLSGDVKLQVWWDASDSFRGRLDTLIYNGLGGLFLVFIVLLVFLRPALAMWVCSGIAVAFLGSIWLLVMTPISLNIISMFAFIMILGIVVDDAIIVGESVHSKQIELNDKKIGAIEGVKSVIMPVWFAVLSTMIFFIPFFYIGDGPEPKNIATPVLLALIFSLFESLFLLPSHLGNSKNWFNLFYDFLIPVRFKKIISYLETKRVYISSLLPYFANNYYRNLLVYTIGARKITIIFFLLLFIISVSILKAGWLPFSFFPRVSSDYLSIKIDFPESISFNHLTKMAEGVEEKSYSFKSIINSEYKYNLVKGIQISAYGAVIRSTLQIDGSNDRPVSAHILSKRLLKHLGNVNGAKNINVSSNWFNIPKPIEYVIRSNNQSHLKLFSDDLALELSKISGIYNISTTLDEPSSEVNFTLKDNSDDYSITFAEILNQIRHAFYGYEIQRIPQLREDVKVFLRFSREDRSNEQTLKNMYVRTNEGISANRHTPLSNIINIEHVDTYKKVERLDLKRVVRLGADVESEYSPKNLRKIIDAEIIKKLNYKYPSVEVAIEGEQQENEEFIKQVFLFLFLSMIGIYGIMAIMFRSYWQPLLVLTAVPFGYMGAIFGHTIIGVNISMFSVLGMIACAGVVVNDNVVLIDKINKLRANGLSVRRSVLNGAIQRFRPIVLTSVTTFLGLTPILLETSVQAQFLIPMVTSLSFGVLFATLITLIFVPALYLFATDLFYRIDKKFKRIVI